MTTDPKLAELAKEEIERLRFALAHIQDICHRRQLPITNEIYEITEQALAPNPTGEKA